MSHLEVDFGAENVDDLDDAFDFVESQPVGVVSEHHLQASGHAGQILVLRLQLVFQPSQIKLQVRPFHHLLGPAGDLGYDPVRGFKNSCFQNFPFHWNFHWKPVRFGEERRNFPTRR